MMFPKGRIDLNHNFGNWKDWSVDNVCMCREEAIRRLISICIIQNCRKSWERFCANDETFVECDINACQTTIFSFERHYIHAFIIIIVFFLFQVFFFLLLQPAITHSCYFCDYNCVFEVMTLNCLNFMPWKVNIINTQVFNWC